MRAMSTFAFIVSLTLCAAGCTSLETIRTGPPTQRVDVDIARNEMRPADFQCKTGSDMLRKPWPMIEQYPRYWLSFVEFDDQGWGNSVDPEKSQTAALERQLVAEIKDHPGAIFDVVVFIHGWHHNSHDDDCNVMEFRSMLTRAADKMESMQLKRRLIGVYVGWRGESMDVPGLRVATVLDRRNAAEHVAKGDVRELFAMLRKHELETNASTAAGGAGDSRFHSMVIGHSFGGLIAFHSLSQAMVNELTATKPNSADDCSKGVSSKRANPRLVTWPDLLVLINPAFEASRFEPLHRLMRPVPGCPYLDTLQPKVVVVTADNDAATGWIFTGLRKVLTVLESYSPGPLRESEEDANHHAIGFVNRYRTHRICMVDATSSAAASYQPPSGADIQDRGAPVWVIGAPKNIVDRHDGFLYARGDPKNPQPVLLNWLLELQFGADTHDRTHQSRWLSTSDAACPDGWQP